MRRKISKKVHKEILKMGGEISNQHWIRKRDWARQDCGFSLEVKYKGWTISSSGYDELVAYRLAFECIINIDRR